MPGGFPRSIQAPCRAKPKSCDKPPRGMNQTKRISFTMSDSSADRRKASSLPTTAKLSSCGRPAPKPQARRIGGARRDRTDDLLLAKQALSQLSYGPALARQHQPGLIAERHSRQLDARAGMVGLGRLERPTSPLSGVRSNHLSYRPL